MNRRQFLAGAAAVGAVTVAGCSSPPNRDLPERPAGEWRQRGRTAPNRGYAPVEVPGRGNRAWNAGDGVTAAPVVADGTAYTVGNGVTAVDTRTGEERWSVDLGGSADHAPAVTDDLLVVGAGGTLSAHELSDGTTAWSVDVSGSRIQGPVTVVPTDDPPLVVVPVAEVGVVAYDPRDGSRRWTAGNVRGAALAADGARVYAHGYRPPDAAEDGGRVTALSADDGTPAWERDTLSAFPSPAPVVTDAGLLVAGSGRLAAYDLDTGRRRRTLTTVDGDVTLAPAVADETAYLASDEGLIAVDLVDGGREWVSEARASVDTGVTVTEETVLVSATSIPDRNLPGVAALARVDGSLRWAHTVEGFDTTVGSSPVPLDGAVLYTGGGDSGVTALGDLPPNDEDS